MVPEQVDGSLGRDDIGRDDTKPRVAELATPFLAGLLEGLQVTDEPLGDRPFHALFEGAIDAIVITDDRGCYVAVNQAACELFGLEREQLLGCSIADFAPTGFNLSQAWADFQMQGRKRGEFSLVRPDGCVREVEYAATANFVPHRHLSVLRDVTERNQLSRQLQALNHSLEQQVQERTQELQRANAELQALNQELQASQQKYQTLFAILPVGVSITDKNGHLIEANPASEAILGVPITEYTQCTCDAPSWQIIRPDGTPMSPEEYPSVRALQQNQPILGVEQGIVDQDGRVRWMITSAAPIPLAPYGVAIAYEDISDRKQMEIHLRESEAKLNDILNSATVGIISARVFADSHYEYEYCSASCEGLFGINPTDLITDPTRWLSLIDPEDVEKLVVPSLADIFAQQPFEFEYRLHHPTQGLRWVHVSGVSRWNVVHQCWIVTQVHADISDRKTMELALRESQATNQAIVASLPDLLMRVHRDGTCLEIHQGRGMKLITPDHLNVGHPVAQSLPPAIAAEQMAYIQRALATNSLQVYDFAVPNSPEGQYAEARIMPMDQDTVLVLLRDITERKQLEIERQRTEIALRHQEQKFRALAENSPDCIMRCNRQFQFEYVNPAVVQITGLTTEQFLGKTTQELGFPETLNQLWQTTMETVFTTGQEQALEYEIVLPTVEQTFYSRVVPEFSSDGVARSVLIVARDITNLKQAQETLLYQAERERLLGLITQHIRRSLHLVDVLNTAVQSVQQLLQADRVIIYQFDPQWNGQVIAEAVTSPWLSMLDVMICDPCFTDRLVAAYSEGRVHQINDLQNLQTVNVTDCYRQLLTRFQINASLTLPIVDGTKLWGLLGIHHCAAPHHWQEWEVDLLQRLTDQLGISIQQTQLYQQVQDLNASLEVQVAERTADLEQALEFEMLLKRITDKVRDSLDEDEILETVVQELGTGLDLRCCDTGIYNAERTVSTITHEFNPVGITAKGKSFSIAEAGHAEIYPFLMAGQSVQFCDRIPCPLRPTQYQLTVLACPIVDDQSVLGDMWLYKSSMFSPSEERLVQQVANQCAIALRQSRLYQAAQAQVAELERLNRLKDDFLSTVSHELRTPMANIKLATDLLEKQLQTLDRLPADLNDPSITSVDPLLRYFQILKQESTREMNLINDLLDLTRIDAETELLNLTSIPLQTWIPHLIEAFETRTQEQQQVLVVDLPADLPLITTDLSYLQRILHELLNNACKYTPAGETIQLSATYDANHLELIVTNSGVEIPLEEHDRVFERFYRIPNNDPWKYGGTGLGLALVKKLVDCLHGSIHLRSSTVNAAASDPLAAEALAANADKTSAIETIETVATDRQLSVNAPTKQVQFIISLPLELSD